MWTRRAFAGFVAAGAASAASAVAAQTAAGGRVVEVAALRAHAETTHPRGREAAADPRWRAHWDDLQARAGGLSDGIYAVGLLRGLGWFRDGHTTVLPFEFTGGVPDALKGGPFGLRWPIRARAFYDGLYVVEAGAEAASLLGARVVSINGVSDIDLVRRFVELWPANNPAWGSRWLGNLFGSAGYAQGLGVLSDPLASIQVQAVAADGARLSMAVHLGPDADKDRKPLPRKTSEREDWTTAAKRGNYLRALPQSRSLYVSIDAMEDQDGKTFEALTGEVFAALEAPALKRVIIDLSRNGGGDNFLGESLRKGLERSRFNRPGGLCVITSIRTFSAAQNLCNRLERETYATFIGEPTGGAPNHYGDASTFTGPATGFTAIVSTKPWFDSYPTDARPWIMPDTPVPITFADWSAGREMALERALAYAPVTEANDLAKDRVFYFERASQATEWKPFWR